MSEDLQCETMGLHPTDLPTSPINRMPPSLFNKRKFESATPEAFPAKKVKVEVVNGIASISQESNDLIKGGTNEIHIRIGVPTKVIVDDDEKENTLEPTLNTIPSTILSAPKSPTPLSSGNSSVSEDKVLVEPKVIVEHQPLPSIYELHQNTTLDSQDNDQYDSGLSDDSSEGDSEEECLSPPPLYDAVLRMDSSGCSVKTTTLPPAKTLYQDRFWSQNMFSSSNSNSQQPPTPPPPPPAMPVQSTAPTPTPQGPYHFLEQQSNQRIECAENGKSYMQLGTLSHSHHLPITPVMQPKPNMVYRRPIQPFRNPMAPPPRPACDHSNCWQRKNSYCYRTQRTRILNLSMHKLHMARQTHEGSLRRSVLICNMLRYIEDESDKEVFVESQEHQYQQVDGRPAMEIDQHYWAPTGGAPLDSSHMSHNGVEHKPTHQTMTPSQYNSAVSGMSSGPTTTPEQSPPVVSNAIPHHSSSHPYMDTYESTLKDFNSAFRLTPFSSPSHSSSSSEVNVSSEGSTPFSDEEKGINWGSVLSLSNQSELDPLNNNSFASDSWTQSTNNVMSVVSSTTLATSTSSSDSKMASRCGSEAASESSAIGANGDSHSFEEDISWKLSSEDVLRVFPNDQNMFTPIPGH